MQIVSYEDSLREMSITISWEKAENYSKMSFAEIFTKHAKH